MSEQTTHSATLALALALALGLSFSANAKNVGGGKHLVLNLVGEGAMYLDTVPDIDGDGFDDPAFCFDVDLIDAKNRQSIGTATDCLTFLTPVGAGVALTGTTFFRMPQGMLITRGQTTVQPVVQTTITPDGKNITHITGASGTGNAIIAGTKRFAGASGTVRLSGMVDLTFFDPAANPPENSSVFFDCLFVINLD